MDAIVSISDLFNLLRRNRNRKLKELGVSHPVTIGYLYEGIRNNIEKRALFKGQGLVVSRNSLIEGSDKIYDIILAKSDDGQLADTEGCKFARNQIIAIIQVTTTLTIDEIMDSVDYLSDIPDLYRDDLPADYREREFSTEKLFDFNSLIEAPELPIRLILGYNRMDTEKSLRMKVLFALNKIMAERNNKSRSIASFPNFIMCNGSSIIKLNGTTFCSYLSDEDDGWINFLGSSKYNPRFFFLKAILHKLSQKFETPLDVFHEDYGNPKFSPFLSTKVKKSKEGTIDFDFLYNTIDEECMN